MGFDTFVARQLRRPSGLVGRWWVGRSLNKTNGPLEDMGLELMKLQPHHDVLEVGFGNGRLISKMAGMVTEGSVTGIDISKTMVRQAARNNSGHIRSGRVKLVKASVEAIPAEEETFDRIFTANTIYFWPSPEDNIREVIRTLKKGGQFYCALRLRKEMIQMPVIHKNRQIFRNLFSRQEIRDFLEKAGFYNIQLHEKQRPRFTDVIASGEK